MREKGLSNDYINRYQITSKQIIFLNILLDFSGPELP